MERSILKELNEWKESKRRKPLILNGARQVGKTWILKEFGKREYENCAYINCDSNPITKYLFQDYDTERIIRVISAETNETIKPGKTLIVLDEIQEEPKALTSLKYFCENASEYHVATCGSLLGINVHSGTGFPVGKVDELEMFPMSFKEFLMACGKENMINILDECEWDLLKTLKFSLIELLRQYYYTGGMPEVVECYINTKNLKKTRELQKSILKDYRRDFSKHVPKNLLSKINMVWDSIPSQLAKENKKFIYGALKKGGRAKEFEDAIKWLEDAGLIYRVNRVEKVCAPLKFYEEIGAFKLFICDLGLLGAMSDVPAKAILAGENIFEEYKGSFTEQYVAQQLISSGVKPYYHSSGSSLEIDFVIQIEDIYPIEVKAEENLKSKSLRTIVNKSEEKITGWRFSMSDYRAQDWMINIPLYSIESWVKKHLNEN